MTRLALLMLVLVAPARAEPLTPPDASHTFVRSDQASKSRAPYNTADVTYVVSKDLQGAAAADAKKVVAHIAALRTPFPVYLGRVHAARFAAEPAYREKVTQLATLITQATGVRCLFSLEDAAGPGAHTIPAWLAPELQELARHATLALACHCDARMTRADVHARVADLHDHYGDTLKIPLHQLFVDVDLAQPAASPAFDRVVGWALEEAYAAHFGGFHTAGTIKKSALTAADSTYRALDEAWNHLAAAHPDQAFAGLRPAKPTFPKPPSASPH